MPRNPKQLYCLIPEICSSLAYKSFFPVREIHVPLKKLTRNLGFSTHIFLQVFGVNGSSKKKAAEITRQKEYSYECICFVELVSSNFTGLPRTSGLDLVVCRIT